MSENNHGNPSTELVRLWQTRMQAGRAAYLAGAYSDAQRQFQLALDLVYKHHLDEGLRSKSIVSLGKVAEVSGNFGRAEQLLREALEIDRSNGLATATAEDYHQLSLLQWRQRHIEQSWESLQEAWRLSNQGATVPAELKAKLLKHFAVLNLELEHYGQCEQYISKAVEFILGCRSLGRHSSIYGDVLLVNVLLLLKQSKGKEALELLPLAMQIIEMNRGIKNPNVKEIETFFQDLLRTDPSVPNTEAGADSGSNNRADAIRRVFEEINHCSHGII